MTEPQASPPAETPAPKPAGSPVKTVVRVVLFVILAFLLCALPYDFLIARPAQKNAWKKLSNEPQEGELDAPRGEPGLLQKKNMGSGDVETTNETVAEAMGKKPSRTETNDKGETIETYTWRGGLLVRTYNIYVVYSTRKDKKTGENKLRLENAFLNERPSDLSVPLQEPEKTGGDSKPTTDGPTPGPPPIPGLTPGPAPLPESKPRPEGDVTAPEKKP